MRPEERTALELALADACQRAGVETTLPQVVKTLLEPSAQMAAAIHTSAEAMAGSCREVALELRRRSDGALAGMFDGRTTAGIDFTAPLVVVDLSVVYHSPALPVVMTCVAAWLQAALGTDHAHRMVVMDESWRMFSHLPIVAWMQQSFELSRASGRAQMVSPLSALQSADLGTMTR